MTEQVTKPLTTLGKSLRLEVAEQVLISIKEVSSLRAPCADKNQSSLPTEA